LETGYTIVFGNQEQLSALCGANDGNLKVIEDYLGAPVVTRGNELTIATSDDDICQKFQILVDRMLSNSGVSESSPEMIRAYITSLDESSQAFLNSFIQIPHGINRVYPKTVNQAELITKLQKHDIVLALGPAGTGKTYIAVAEALKMVLSHQARKIVLTRPVMEAGENLGFLPGDLEQKINPYMRPLYDAMESLVPQEIIRKMQESNMIEVSPLAYMRGRSLNNSVILLDEAQNTTKEQMKMFLTRLGQGSRAIIMGDPAQTDLPHRIESGLVHAARILGNIPEIAIVYLENKDVVRNALVKKIIQEYEQETL
jgi:phosphate starvation-inducible PhoH-like protein